MATLTARPANPVDALAQDKRVARALAWIDSNADWVTNQQVAITEIPAPEFHEQERGAFLASLFRGNGLDVHTDAVGNVIGELSGSSGNDVVLIIAHLDTVFPAGTDVRVRRVKGRLEAPGISDDGAGLASMVGVVRAIAQARVKPRTSVLFVAGVGEEGEGNLRGIRALMDEYKGSIRAVIALDGAATDYVTTVGLASRRLDIQVTGPGGHSWSDFGSPNPITALARGIVQFSAAPVPEEPRTTFNFGVV